MVGGRVKGVNSRLRYRSCSPSKRQDKCPERERKREAHEGGKDDEGGLGVRGVPEEKLDEGEGDEDGAEAATEEEYDGVWG